MMKKQIKPLSGILSPYQEKEAAKGFTLVELIVVITILAILGTIAFISLQGYSASSRDSVRITDISSMKTSLELFHLDAGKYPLPDNPGEVTYGSDLLWSQGTLGSAVVSQLSRSLNKIPTDPLTDKEYVYSVSGYRNDFQILNLLEGDLAINTISQTNAANTKRIPRIDGKYNGLFLKTPNYIFPTPSLITSEPVTGGLTINEANIRSQIITGGENIPNIGNINSSTGTLDIKLSVYEGIINGESDENDKINAINAIKTAYSGSTLAGSDIYKTILETEGNEALVALADTVILDKASKTTLSTSCSETPSGVTKNFYDIDNVEAGQSCEDHKKTFTCENTVWKDNGNNADIETYLYESCSVAEYQETFSINSATFYGTINFSENGFDWYKVNISDWNNVRISDFMSSCESIGKKLVPNYGTAGGRRYPITTSPTYCSNTWNCIFTNIVSEPRLAFVTSTDSLGGPGFRYGINYIESGTSDGIYLTTTPCSGTSNRLCYGSEVNTIIPISSTPSGSIYYIPCK